MSKILNSSLFFFLGICLFFAQEEPKLDLPRTEYSAVAPEVAKFGKYGDVPVDLSTGRINYTIPLHTIKVGDQEFPISLSYNYNGLKNEIPGSAGIGWDLMAGGSLSIQNQGGNDGQYNTHIADKVLPVLNNSASCFPEELGDKLLQLLNLPDAVTNGNTGDTEPDRYVISSPYISATYYKNHLDNYIFIPHKNYIVSSQEANGLTQSYTVLDDSGTEYVFQSRSGSSTNIENEGDQNTSIPSVSYKLNYVNLPAQKGSLSFEYNANRPYSSIKRTYSSTYLKLNSGGQTYESNSSSLNTSTAQSGGSEKLLTNIYFPNGEVIFTYNQGRIAEMNVWSILPDGTRKLLIKYGFVFDSYGYLLEKVTKHSRMGNEEPFYDFQYHSPVTIANLGEDDLGTDAWGYLNGKQHTYPAPGLANKVPVYDSTLPGALKEIKYPTGGFTTIEYEANTVNGILYPYDAPNKSTTTYNVNTNAQASTPSTNQDEELFTLDAQSEITVNYSFVLPDFVSSDISVVNNATNQIVFSRNEDDAGTSPSGTAVLNLSAGTYKIIAEIEGQTPASAYIEVRGNPEITYNPDFIIGGIRVKQTIDCPTLGATSCVTQKYDYKTPILLDIPILNYDILVKEQLGAQFFYKDATVFINNNQASFSTYNGSHILYKTVEVLKGEESENGKRVLHYSGNTNANFTSTEQPFVPFLRRDWEKGRLVKEEIYKYELGGFVKIKETVNTYESVYPFHNETDPFTTLSQSVNSDKIVWGFVSSQYKQIPSLPVIFDFNDCLSVRDINKYEYYAYLPQRYDLISSVTTENSVVSSQFYQYDNDYGQLKKIEIPRSIVGDTTIYTYQYPYDMNGTIFSGLVNENRIGNAIRLETKYNNIDKETSTVNYSLVDGSRILPLETVREKSENGAVVETTYDRYTDNGKLAQYTTLDGRTTILIWGYRNEFPIAKIENASYLDIAAALGVTVTVLEDYDETDLSQINGLRGNSNLSQAMITTYTYDPLVGVTSITDTRGYTTYYIYDNFNRLKEVRDGDNNLVTDYQYHYQN